MTVRNRLEEMARVSATALIRAYHKGTITLDELGDEFGRREWNEFSWAGDRDLLSDADREDTFAVNDPYEAGTWGEVLEYFMDGRLSFNEYSALYAAVFGDDADQ